MVGASGTIRGFVGSFVAERRRFWFFKVVRKLLSRCRSVDILIASWLGSVRLGSGRLHFFTGLEEEEGEKKN